MVLIPAHNVMVVKSLPTFRYTPPSLSLVYLATYLASAVECSIGKSSSEYLKPTYTKLK